MLGRLYATSVMKLMYRLLFTALKHQISAVIRQPCLSQTTTVLNT